MIKLLDKISEIPNQFNRLEELVKSLERRVARLEKPSKKERRND